MYEFNNVGNSDNKERAEDIKGQNKSNGEGNEATRIQHK